MSLAELVGGFDASLPIEEAWTPPSGWYTDPRLFELERTTLLAHSWQPVARLSELAVSGDYVSGCFAGEPWVVVRDGGQLRAFANVCRHKGREVVTGSGRSDQLVCGYHAWSYDLNGRLRKAPRMGGVQAFDREAMRLTPLGVDVWGPWVFVHQNPDAPRLHELHPELDAQLEASGWSELRFSGTRTWDIACNWKVYADNYLDGGYHIPHMHPTLDAQLDMASYRTVLYERSCMQTSGSGDHEAGARIGGRAIYAYIYPCLALNRYGSCLDSNHIIPIAPDRCRVEYEFYFDASVDDAAIERSMEQSDITQREDIEICESVQRGLRSANYDRGRYAPSVEVAEHHFHQFLARHYRSELKRP